MNLKQLATIGMLSISTLAGAKQMKPEEVPTMNPACRVAIQYINDEYFFEMYDFDFDGIEDAKLLYQFYLDGGLFFTRLREYSIDWNKNDLYEESERNQVVYADEETENPVAYSERK